MIWLFRDGDAPSLDHGTEQALEAIDAHLAVTWSRWILDEFARPIHRNWDGARIPIEGRDPFYTFWGYDTERTEWVPFLEVVTPDARLPKALERDLWINRNRGTRVVEEDRLAREEAARYRHTSRVEDQVHWLTENKTYWKDALEGDRGAGFTTDATKVFSFGGSHSRHSYRGSPEIYRGRTRREQGLTPHPSGRNDY